MEAANTGDAFAYSDFSGVKLNYKSQRCRLRNFYKNRNLILLGISLIVIGIFALWLSSKNTKIEQLKAEIAKVKAEEGDPGSPKASEEKLKEEKEKKEKLDKDLTDLNSKIDSSNQVKEQSKQRNSDLNKEKESLSTKILQKEDSLNKAKAYKADSEKKLEKLKARNSELRKEYESKGGKVEPKKEEEDKPDQPEEPEKLRIASSEIVDKSNVPMIEDWIKMKVGYLCYKSSRDGFNATVFHQMCDEAGPTITFAKIDSDEIVGGFTRYSWKGNREKKDNYGLVFNLNKKKKFAAQKLSMSVSPSIDSLPAFSKDLVFNADGTGYTVFPTSYGTSQNKQADFTSNTQFFVQKLEVYGCGNVIS